MKSYLLTIDAGNTHIKMQLMRDGISESSFRLTTKTPRTSDEYGIVEKEFLDSLNLSASDIEAVIISSVVPKIMYALTSSVKKYLKKEPMIIGPGIRTGIQIRNDNPKEVGADRLVDVVAAYYTYHRSCIIVDFGTATTFDYVSAEGIFQYTVIAPGLDICAQALTSSTAKLPEIEIEKPASILGRNTISGMQAGVVYGYIGCVEGILKRMKQELKDQSAYVIATGGLGKVIANETSSIDLYDPDIAGKGMYILYQKNKENL
ncbi:MAG: type III pantothenate kinase [Solobacterium sp.]|jgi:type III pantothenate kinase|nr:type III pantothenate kinase [Solobacterium sp.]MCI6745215.1 type III pantothenate kinase [Anaerolactibacter massiliensis]